MPGCARKDVVREGEIGVYHCWSRCVQRAYLYGKDPYTGRNFEHRRGWIQSLLEYQAAVFAVDVGNYSILSNHQHLLARTRPDIAATWSDEEVAWRWKMAWPHLQGDRWHREPTDEELAKLLAQPEKISKLRANLASLSWFMARWKEPIAKLANIEMQTSGHFYEQRFGCREILDDAANLCCNVYIDLNQVRAGMVSSLEASASCAIHDRLEAWRQMQAEESVAKFQKEAPNNYRLEAEDMQKLLADCFLAPISDQGPLLLVGATDKPSMLGPLVIEAEAEHVAGPPEDSEGSDPHDEAGSSGASTVATEVEPAAGRSKPYHRRPPASYTIHRRLRRRQRRRASSHPILGMPLEEYLHIVSWTARRLGTNDAASPPKGEYPAALDRRGIKPSHWLQVVERFGEMFYRAVGHTDQIARVVRRCGGKWLRGQRTCADAFT